MNLKGDAGSSAPLSPDQKSGVWGESDTGYGVVGTSSGSSGVQGGSLDGIGAAGTSKTNLGVYGLSEQSTGVYGESQLYCPDPFLFPRGIGMQGVNSLNGGIGLRGDGGSLGYGVFGQSDGGTGVQGTGKTGVFGQANADGAEGVVGTSANGSGVGVRGVCGIDIPGSPGIQDGYGVIGEGGNIGIYAQNSSQVQHKAFIATRMLAGDFYGDIAVHGRIQFLSSSLSIDHPLDPANRYLNHSSIESTEMKNLYDGTVAVDADGEAVISLPTWFQALNTDYRYQLTSIGAAAPSLHIAEEISENQFRIAGGVPGSRVSWQVTGTRCDPWAISNQRPVESDKPANERGTYLSPELYGQSEQRSVRMVRYPPGPISQLVDDRDSGLG